MSNAEIKVIAAAAVAFVIINIFMWTIIAFKEKKERKNQQNAFAAPPAQPFGNTVPQPQRAPQSHTAPASAMDDSPTELLGTDNNIQPQHPRQIRSDFKIIDNIIMIHTDEVIE